MRRRLLVVLLVCLIPASLRADPITIVNTGPGPSTLPGFSLGGLQWVAVQFPVTGPAVISVAQGWMIVSRGGLLDLSLYRDGGEIPGDLLFRNTGRVDSGNADWRGLSTLAWPVTPGTYWIGFEVRGPDTMSGALPFPSERPLQNGAVLDLENADPSYRPADAIAQMGLRIFAVTASPVPEPASILLVTTGLGGLLLRRHRKHC